MTRYIAGIITALVLLMLTESSASAQYGGTGVNATARPQRKLKKSQAPVLSPALNLVPGVANSFEGQFLMRTLPQEQAYRNIQQTGKALDALQSQVIKTENQLKTGVQATGHRTQFMNYGTYFPSSRNRGR